MGGERGGEKYGLAKPARVLECYDVKVATRMQSAYKSTSFVI